MKQVNKADYSFRLFPVFEEEARIFGQPISNVMAFFALLLLEFLIPLLLDLIGVSLGLVYYGIVVIVDLIVWRLLKNLGKRAYPNFLFAFVSKVFLQPKKINSLDSNIEWISLEQMKKQSEEEQAKKTNK